jgi:hypothetical protein
LSIFSCSFYDIDDSGLPKVKAFTGKWVFPKSHPHTAWSEQDNAARRCQLAVTAKGNIATLCWTEDSEGKGWARFRVFPSLQAAAERSDLNDAAREAMEKVGVPVEELDI